VRLVDVDDVREAARDLLREPRPIDEVLNLGAIASVNLRLTGDDMKSLRKYRANASRLRHEWTVRQFLIRRSSVAKSYQPKKTR